MVSSFPKMQKSSASFSQSIRNRLRLKNLQAQAKNFCRVLDIRVSDAVDSYPFHSAGSTATANLVVQIGFCEREYAISFVEL